MGESHDDEATAEAAARQVQEGTDRIWIPIDFLKEDIPPPKAPLPALSVQVGRMTIIERVKLAIVGGKEARVLLSHDTNRVVRRYVLANPRITDHEVASIANSRQADEEVLRIVAGKREWMKSYQVRLAVVRNPKTPLPTAMDIVPTLMDRDLLRMSKSKDAPEGVVHHVRRVLLQRRDRQGN